MNKLRATGKPLGEYVNGKIYYGIKTGLNEAFVIDAETKARLIDEDARSAEVIKPFLAGRDIKRYQTPTVDKFLITFKNGSTRSTFGRLDDEKAWSCLQGTYSAICKHLQAFEKLAKLRADQGEYWWELRACAYYNEFEKPKIVVPAIIKEPSNLLEREGSYSNDKTTIIGTDSQYVLAVMNSKAVNFFMQQISSTKQGGFFEYKPVYIAQIPVPPPANDKVLIQMTVDQIIAAKAANPAADTSALEAEIDRLVYGLYGLTDAEIATVEGF